MTTPKTKRRPTSTLLKLGFSVLTVLAFFVGLELVLKLTLPAIAIKSLPNAEMWRQFDAMAFTYDPDLLWYHKNLPNGDYNADGFLNGKQPVSKKKKAGIKRAVAFGDSQTQGAGLKWHDAWPIVVERELGGEWEVLNAAVPGYRSLNVYRQLRKKIIQFEPDAILVDCMPYDSPRDDRPLSGDVPGGDALKSLLWESWTYYSLRRVLEKLQPNRYRWLDTPLVNDARLGEGNHELILQWARHHGIITIFTEYPVQDRGQFKCYTLPGELPADAYIAPTCAALEGSGLSLDELFQDTNHMTARGTQLMGAAVAETLREATSQR